MARANLTVDAELIAAWRARNINGAALRWIQADVDAPSARIVLRGVRAWGAPDGGVHVPLSDSFALIRADVKSAPGARLYLICLDDNPAASAATNTDRWVVMSIVLEGTPPKARMLVAAARDDVKRTLSSAAGGAFAPDYHVTELEEIDAATYASHADRSDPTASMTRLEKDVADIARLSAAEALAAGPRSLGMATVPFALSKEASDALSHLLNSGPGVVQLSVAAAVARGSGAAAPVVGAASNVIALANTVTLHADDGLRASVTREVLRLQAETGAQPRFYAVHTHSNADAASPGMNGEQCCGTTPNVLYVVSSQHCCAEVPMR